MPVSTAVQAGSVARVVGIKTEFKDLRGGNIVFLPQRIAVIAQGASAATYSTDKKVITSRKLAGDTYGYGSPIERIVNQLFPANGDGVGNIPVTVFPLVDDGSGVAADGSIEAAGTTQTETKSYILKINEISVTAVIPATTIPDDALTIFKTAIDSVIEMPVTTGTVAVGSLPVDAKWAGTSSNGIFIEIEGDTSGLTFSITQATGGLVNPDVDDALNKIGNIWETMIINGMEYDDDASLDKYVTFNENRWLPLVRKPLTVFSGYTETTQTAGTVVTDARKTDRTNAVISAPGSNELPFVIAARALARAAVLANENPPHDYAGKRLTGLVAGPDVDQWSYTVRNDAVTKGLGTTELVDSIIEMSDTVTMYHPVGEEPPAYRYVVDITKLQNILFNTDLIFASDEWKGAPLLPNGDVSVNPTVKKPKDAVAEVASMIDFLGLNAIISDPKTAKSTIQAEINETDPKRLDVSFTVQLSGNTNIISVDFNFGFFFGSLAA